MRASCSMARSEIGFRNALDEGRLDLVAERLLDGLAPLVMLVAPAEVPDRADIDEADLEFLLRDGASGGQGESDGTRQGSHSFPCHRLSSLFWIATFVQVSAPVLQLAPVENCYLSGTKGVPSEPGAPMARPWRIERRRRAMIVARYGTADRTCEGTPN